MNKPSLLFPIASFALAGCLFDKDKEYPPLNKEELIGCWTMIYPTGFSCWESCFDTGNAYYRMVKGESDTTFSIELTGIYIVNGNSVGTSHSGRSTGRPYTSVTDGSTVAYTIERDTLYALTEDGKSRTDRRYQRSDSIHNCGPHWLFFAKPAGWTLP